MATEAEVPESVSATTEGEDGYLTTGKFDISVNQFSPVQLKKSEGEEGQHPEQVKCFVEGEIAHVESKNGISECGNPLETLSDSKVDKQEEDAQRKVEALDIGEASVVKEEDSEGFSAVEHRKTTSTDHEGESETNLYENIQPVTYELARPKLNSEEVEAATSRESSKTNTTAGDERQVVEQSCEEEGKVEEVNTSYDTIEDETPDEQNLPVASILMRNVTESEIAEVGESTMLEPNENVERSEEVLNVSTVKGDEGDQGDDTDTTKDDKNVDKFTTKVAEDDEYTSAVTIKETSAKVTPNDDESSPQTLEKCDSGEELQHSRDVLPEESKTETSRENAEESTCTKEETTIQHTQESLDEEKKEATENTRNLEDDNAREEVLETSGTKQETGEHLAGEIHAESPQDFVDKETNEETSREYQACVEAADLSTNTEEKNLEEQATPELSSPLVVEETATEIPKEEETGVLILKEEKKEEDAECNEPAEVVSMTHETQSETTEDTTEPNKDLSAPISEESNKTFVENISALAEVSEMETEKNIQEKDGLAVSNSDSASGEVSHVTDLKEAETEKEEQKENIDTALEEKGQAAILKDEMASEVEDIGVQAEENCESKEKLEEPIPTAADEGEAFSKEAEAEIEEQINNSDVAAEEKVLGTILTNEKSFDVEDTNVQAEKNVESNENLEETIPTAADEGETSLQEAEAESKDEQIPTTADEGEKSTYISHEDIEVQADENFITLENLENPIPTTSGERETGLGEAEAEIKEQVKSIDIVPEEIATNSTAETPLDIEDIGVQAEESLKSKENLEEQIPTAADESEKFLKEAEAENKEQIDEETLNSQESSDKEKELTEITNTKDDTEREEVLETTSTEQETGEHVVHEIHTVPEPPRDSIDKETDEDNSAEYQACTEAADLSTSAGEKNLEEHAIRELSSPLVVEEATNEIPKEQETYTTLLEGEEKEGHATCNEPNDEYEAEIEKNIQEKDGNTVSNSESLSEEPSHVTALKESETEIERQDKNIDTAPEEKGQATISADETASEVETFSKEAEAENEEQINNSDVAAEEKVLETILTNEKSFDVEDTNVQAEKNVKSNENLEENFPTTADEGKTSLQEGEAESKDEIKSTDIAHADTGGQGDGIDHSEENLDKQIPADERETSLKAAEAEYKEQVKHADIVPEEKDLATILTDETPLDVEDIEVKTEDCVESKENVKEQIPITADEGEKSTYISPEDIKVQAEENFITVENLENPILTTSGERETGLGEAEAEIKEQVKSIDIVPEEMATISTAETPSDVEVISEQAEESLKSKENVEEQIPTAADEGGKFLKEAEAENKEQIDEENLNSQESSDQGKQEVTETTNTLEDDTAREEVLETTSMEQETGEHVVHEIHTVVEPPQDSIDKETNEENSAGYQACTDAADLSTSAEEKNLEEHDIRELSSPLVVEEQTNEIPKEEETYATLLEEEKKEGHATCNEPTEKYEAEIEKNIQEKDGNAVSNSESLSGELSHVTTLHESETEIERQDKNIDTAAEEKGQATILKENIDTAPEEKGQATILKGETALEVEDFGVQAEEKCESKENLEEHIPTAADKVETFSKEAEAESEEQINNSDVAAEEKVLETILTNEKSFDVEDTNLQAEKNVESNENLEENFPTAADEGETFPKEAEAESKDEIKNANIPHADIGHGDEIDSSEENLDKQIPAGECETSLKAAEAEYKEQVIHADIAPEEKGLATILTDETPLDVEDVEVKTEDCAESKENVEEQIPTTADEGEKSTYISPQDIEVQADENFITLENLEKTSGERETGLGEAEAEIKEQVESIDIVPEQMATISTAETPSDVEVISEQAEESLKSKQNVEQQIPTVADEGGKFLKEAEAENKEQIDEENLNSQESSDIGKQEVKETTNTLEDDTAREEVLETTSMEQETGEHVVHEIHTVPEPPRDSIDKETDEDNSAGYQACTDAADLSTSAEEKNLEEHDIQELSSPLVVEEETTEIPKEEETYATLLEEEKKEGHATCNEPTEKYEAEIEKNIQDKDGNAVSNSESLSGELSHVTALHESETEIERQDKNIDTAAEEKDQATILKENIDTAPEEKGQATILKGETALEVEDIGVQAADKVETFSKEAEAENEEQINNSDVAAEEKVLETILRNEKSFDVEDTNVQAEKNVESNENLEENFPTTADEGKTSLQEAEAESKDEIKSTDIAHADTGGQGDEIDHSEENLDKQIPARKRETSLKAAEAEYKEQVKHADIVPEEKDLATILTDETPLDVEDVEVKTKDCAESKENVEEQIPTTADEGEKSTYISPQDIEVQADENFVTLENLEKTSGERETGLGEAEAEIKEQVKSIDIVPEEIATISTAETPLDIEDIGVQAEETLKSKENVEEHIPTTADEGERFLKEAKAENKEQIEEENLNSQEQVTEITNTIQDDTEREEVLETTSTEQETGEHVVHEIHTVPEPPRDSIDKDTNEDNSAEYQACTEAADLSTSAEEKNLEEHAIRELSSPLVVEEATNEIPKEEETYTTLLEEEEKEGNATCNEPNEEYEAEIEKKIQEKDGNTVSNSESLSGELSHVTALKESETEIERQDKNIDTAPEEKGQATISADETASEVEDIDVQLKENRESEENLEEQFPMAADEGEIISKEAEAENQEQIKNVDIAHEDVDAKAEKTVNSEEDIDKQIPPIAHEGETSLKEAQSEDKEQVTYADIAPEEKGLATTLTDETPLEAEDIGVKAEESFESKEKSEEKNPLAADEDETFSKEAEAENKEQIKCSDIAPEDKGLATILTDEQASNIEDIGLQAEETFNSSENLESKIPSTADEHETSLKEAEAINTEQFKYTDIVPEEKGLANIVMDETSLDVEDIDVKSDEVSESKENVEEQIPTASHESGTFLNEAEAEGKEHIYNTDISPEEKSLATISTDEATLDVEDIGVQAERSFESKEDFEEKIPTEDETFLKEAEAETKAHIKCSDIAPEEKGPANILTDETSLDVKDIEIKAEESFESNENLEKQIPTAEGEGETRLREAEAESDEQVKNDIAPEEKVLETISKDEMALDIDDAYVHLQAEENSDTKEFSDEENPKAADEGEEKIAHGNVVLNDTPGVQILEEAEPKVGVEEESCKSDAQPEKTSTTVEEVFDESKITGRDFNKAEIAEGNVACFTQESTEDDTVNISQEIEIENKNLKEEGSCIEGLKEGNGDNLSPEYIREDESETLKDDRKDAVKFGGEILKESQADGIEESITGETTVERSEEIVTSPVTYEEGEQGESSSPVSKEEGSNEDTFSTKVAEEGDGDNSAVTVIETSADVNGEEGLPQAVQKYEPVEGHEKLLDLMPEESKTESLSENAEVVTCTEEEIKIQNIQESLDEEKKEEETTPVNDTKENETEVEEVSEIASTEQEAGERATREIHTVADNTQEFNDKETTKENLNEYQVSSEAADSSTDIVGKNSDEQASRELSSSLVGEDTSFESSKQEENYVLSLKEEVNEATHAPTSEEKTHTELKGAEAETKEQVKDIELDHEEKGLATILTDGATLENVDSEEFSENQIPTVADEGEYNTELAGDKAAEESFQVQSLEEAEPKLRVEDESRESEDIVEEPQLPEQVLDEPKSTGGDFSEGQTTESNAAICTPERIQEETAKNCQDSDKETENLMEEGSSIESVTACNTDDPSQEFILEDGSKKFDDNKQDTVKFEGEILKETEIAGVGESITYETNQIAESSEEISGASPVKYEEGQPGEGSSQDSAKASKDEDVTEDDDNNGAVTVTESSAEVTSKGEDELAQALEKSEPEEEKVLVKISDVADAKEVCDLEDKASFAEKTTEETSLQMEGHAEVSELAPEELDVEATEEEFKESSEIVPKSDSRSIDVVSKDEIVTNQTLDKGILQEQVEIPSSTLLTEEKEIEASQHEHETPTKDKNIEEEHNKEELTDENTGELSAVRSEDETPLQKEVSEEMKASELALEKLDACDTDEGIKETLKAISKSDSQSTDAVSKDEIVADQTHLEASCAPKEEELKTYQDDGETTTEDKVMEEEYAKKTEVSADENGRDLVAATLAEETLLKEEPGEIKISELALRNLDAGEMKEEIKESFEKASKSDSQGAEVVLGDETTAYQARHEGESNTELAGVKAAEESFQVQSLEEAEPKLTVEDESHESEDHPKNNMIVEEPQLLEQVLDEPKSTDGDFGEGQTTEGNAAICAPDIIQEETAKDSQDTDKETENLQEEILKEPEIAGVGESTTFETNQVAESSEEISDASTVKYEGGQPGEGSSQDSAKASKEEDVTEDNDNNGAVTVTESSAEVTSKGEEDSAQALEKSEPEEEKVPVKISDVADAKEVCDLEDKASFAEKTTEGTSLQTEGHAEVSELAPEKLDVEATEEEFKESSELVPESDSRSIDVVSKDEIVTSQTLDKGILQEQVEIPSSTLLTEEKEIKASQHEHETPTKDKNIEEEHNKEELPDENTGDLSAVRSEDETSLQKEVSEEMKASELALENLDAGDTDEGIKETLKAISKSDSQSTAAVSKDEIVADQTHLEASCAPKEEELKTYQDDGETTTEDKVMEEEYAKKTKVSADENGRDLVAATLAEETLLKEEPGELKISELALRNLDAGETKEEIKESFEKASKSDSQSAEVVLGDETTAYQARHQGESNTELAGVKATEESFQVQSLEEAEPKLTVEDECHESEDHPENNMKGESTTYETNQIAESSEEISGASTVKYEGGQPGEGSSQDSAKASKDEDVTEDDDNNGAVTVTETSAEVTSKGEEDSAQALEKSEPEEEKVPVKISDVADAKEVCNLEDKASFAEKTTGETSLQTEGHAEVSEFALEKLDVEATEEEFKGSSEIVHESDSRSIDVVSKDEIVTSQTLDEGISQEQVEIPSSKLLTEAKEIEASQHEHETPTKDKNIEEHEKEMPADENARDISAERSEDETPLQKEESKELKASELALEKLDAGDTEEGIKETLKTISKSDSQSTDAVSKDEIVADQTHLEAYALLPMEEELKIYQDDRETTTQDKIIEEEHAKKTEVPADENGRDLVAATLAEEALLKEEPGELKVSELVPENLDAGETKEEIKKSFESKSDSQSTEVVSGDETTAYQTELAGDKAVEESFQVQSIEEAEPKLRVEDESRESEEHPENNNMIVEEPQLLEQVLDEPKSTDRDSSEGQTTKRNAAICTPEVIVEGTAKNSQDSDKETENSQEEILKEPEIAGVGESTTYETNQIAETSEEIFDASPVKYEEGRPGEGSSQDSAKASKEEDVTEDDDINGAVSVTESNAEVTSKGEEDSAQALEKYEPEEEKVPVKISDVSDAKEVCDVEDKSSFAEKTTEETSLQREGHADVSELALEKLDVEATEEEFKEGYEIVCESDSRSIDVVSKDEIATSQTLDEGISQEQVEIPSPTLITEAKEIEASQHEHETPTKDKNIEEVHEQEMPAAENAGDLSAVRSEDETPLPKEESEELKASELALEKLDAGDTKEEIKETLKAISKSDSQSTDAVPKDEIVADQTHLEASHASLPKEEELKTYQGDRETTTQDKGVEEKYAKETEVPADENGRDLVAPTLAEETLLQKEEPEELKVSELAPENLDAGEMEEEIKESFEKVSKSDSQGSEVVSGDETTAYQTLHEGISNEQLQLPSSTLVPEEKEIKISQREHETTTQDKNKEGGSTEKNEVPADENTRDLFVAAASEEETCLQKEEPREFKACELALEKLDAGETEEIKETLETISKSDSQSIDTVSKDDIVADQTLVGASYTSLPKEKEHEAGENETTAYWALHEGESNTEPAGVKAAEESFQVQSLEEAEPKLTVEDESRESDGHPENNMTVEEPQLLEHVLDEPRSTDGDFGEGKTTEGNAALCTPDIILEETPKNSQNIDKETENLQEEILEEPEIAGVGKSTTYETNQIEETSEEIFDASPVKYGEGQLGEGSSQDSAKASKEEDVNEDDDNNGAVTVTESSAEVTSKGEEDLAHALEKYEPEEEKVPVKISDVADAKEVRDLEDKASFAEKTTEETSLQTEGHAEVSELAPQKLAANATEEECKEGSEIVPESDSRSIDVVSKDEIVTSLTLDEGISQDQVEIPSSTLLAEAKETEASQHEHETPTKDKNIEEEHEREMPADENAGDLSAVRSEDETPLPKEESEELKASELALEKLEAGDTEEEIKQTLKTISKSDSQSTDAVPKDEIVADQTHLEASNASIPKEEELKTYQDDRETTTQDKGVEEEYAKETEVPADENGRDLVAPTLAEETLLQKEEPEELKVSELAPENLDAGETEEETKESFEKVSKSDSQGSEIVLGDETTAYQALHEGISNEQLQLPSSTLVPEEKEIKISQREHETTTQDKNKEGGSTEKNEVPADENTRDLFIAATSEEETCLQKEEPREFKACELAPEKLDAGETEEIKETLETISKSDSPSIDTVSKDDIVADQTLVGASYTSLPKEKEHEAGENEVPADENGGDLISARSVEETILQKEEHRELKVSELAREELNAGETEEEIKKTPERVSKPESSSTDVVSRDEAISELTLHEGISTEKLQIPSSVLLPEEKEIKAPEEHGTTFSDKNIEDNSSNLQMQDDENTKATSMEKETSLTKEEPRELKASDFEPHLTQEVPRESSNEEIKEDEILPKESEPDSVREESHHENKAKAEKQEEQTDETSTIRTNEHQHELSEVDEKGIPSEKYERQLTFEDLSIKERDPRFFEDKTIQGCFPEEEKRVEEAAFEFDLKNQEDEINSKSSITEEAQIEKDSKNSPIVETSQEVEAKDTKSTNETCVAPEIKESIQVGTHSPEEKEATTTSKEQQIEEDEEEEHEISEEVKADEEKGEKEHKNGVPGYDSPIMVEAPRDADVNVKVVSQKKSNNILSGIKHSISKVKKAITCKSSHSKTKSEK